MIKDSGIVISPDNRRVILRPYIPADQSRVPRIVERVMALSESDAEKELKSVTRNFSGRHHNFNTMLERQFEVVRAYMPSGFLPSKARKLLIAAYFIGERSYESTALFNPSIVEHPDQSGVSRGSLRVIITLRATGEGHISALTFRSGVVGQKGSISIDEDSDFACTAQPKPNALYDKICFNGKLYEMGLENDCSKYITAPLGLEFTLAELQDKVDAYITGHNPVTPTDRLTCEKVLWLARCNYEAAFDPLFTLSERVLFPFSPSEQNGMEDARFVLFMGDDGSVRYYA
ncbi:MAG: glycosidase, partial [Candidatus Omnitrophica bacterium]|nr:glycosidase [Candidatus Omnitrophota bacterium]